MILKQKYVQKWYSSTIYEGDTYAYIYINACPISHHLKIEDEYVEIVQFVLKKLCSR